MFDFFKKNKKEKDFDSEGESASLKRTLGGWQNQLISGIAIVMSIFHIYVLGFHSIPTYMLYVLHTGFAMVIGISLNALTPKAAKRKTVPIYDVLFILIVLSGLTYQCVNMKELISRLGVITNTYDTIFGIILIIAVLELTRRTNGPILPVLCILFILYARFGYMLTGILGHKGYKWERIFSFMMSQDAVYGVPIQSSARICFLFLVFSAFLMKSGAGDTFINFAVGIAGKMRGGPAKVAIVASSLFGTISGNSVANVLSTGAFTIPMMKNIGYSSKDSGAICAVASTGGQIMPPIMGAAAFILSSTLGIAYSRVMAAAIIPAILYYLAVFMMVDLEAIDKNIVGLPDDQVPDVKKILKERWAHFLPLIALIICLTVLNTSIIRSALIGIVSVILCTAVFKDEKNMILHPMNIVEALRDGAKGSVSIVVACACAGIITGVLNLTGTGLKFAGVVMSLSHGNLVIALVLTMLVSMVLGMGLPTAASYIITSSICAPALTQMGVSMLAAHMFCFYFACVSAITPPVALAAYAGAQLSGDDPMRVGFAAVKYGIVAFFVPYMFVYGEELLGSGTVGAIALCLLTSAVGTITLSMAIEGVTFKKNRLNILIRAMYAVSAIMLIAPGVSTDLMGVTVLAAAVIISIVLRKAIKPAAV